MPKPKKLRKSKKYTLSKPYRAIAYQLNKAYDEIVNAGLTSNNIRLFEQSLENFYNKYGLKVANPHHITMQKEMTKEQAEELAKIADTFVDKAVTERAFYIDDLIKKVPDEDKNRILDQIASADFDNIVINEDEKKQDLIPWDRLDVDKFEAIQEKYGVDNVQDFINWTDEMERYRGEAFLREFLSSDQIADIFAYGIEKSTDKIKIDFDMILKIAQNEYNKNGYEGDQLRIAIIKKIKGL